MRWSPRTSSRASAETSSPCSPRSAARRRRRAWPLGSRAYWPDRGSASPSGGPCIRRTGSTRSRSTARQTSGSTHASTSAARAGGRRRASPQAASPHARCTWQARPVDIPDDVRGLLAGRNFGHVATLLPDGSPHSVPVWVGIEEGRVVFFTQPGSRKARNVERDPRVAISVVDHERPYLSAHLRGRVVGKREGDAALEVKIGRAHV